jgi:hypothetical protein
MRYIQKSILQVKRDRKSKEACCHYEVPHSYLQIKFIPKKEKRKRERRFIYIHYWVHIKIDYPGVCGERQLRRR